jgi:hypothetical protein
MREVLGAGRGVQAGEVEIPAMAAEAGRKTRQGAESDEESDGCDGAQDCEAYGVRYSIENSIASASKTSCHAVVQRVQEID